MSVDNGLGTEPIELAYAAKMKALARDLDRIFNGELRGDDRTTGFVLMIFPFGDGLGRCNYISNAERADVIALLREQLAYFDGVPEAPAGGLQ